MTLSTELNWLKRQAELEDNCFVSVGGLVSAIENLEHKKCLKTVEEDPAE